MEREDASAALLDSLAPPATGGADSMARAFRMGESLMPVGESDIPGKGNRPRPIAPGNRPVASASANRPIPAGGANRPIPLKPRADLPDADDDFDDEEETDLREVLRNAPAWLVSTVFHMLLLIALGLLAFSTRDKSADVAIEVSYTDPGEQLEDPSVLESAATQIETFPEQIITPTDLDPVEDPLAAPLEMVELAVPIRPTMAAAPSDLSAPQIGMALKGREVGSRQALLEKYGGNGTTESAVEAGLEWLVRQQRDDGSWSLAGPYVDGATGENVPAATAMALLAFQGHGDTHRDGKYAKIVSRGWRALLKMQQKDGLFSGQMAHENQMLYTHAQASIAICELYGMTRDTRFRRSAELAIAYAVKAQDPRGGGWRYIPRQDSDTSVTGWFVMALQSARMAGLRVPDESLARISAYLDSAAINYGRRYGYIMKLQPSDAVSAEGLLCRQYLGWKQDDPRLVEGISDLVRQSPISYENGRNYDVYYWYYATQAAHHMEGKIWEDWNGVMRKVVPENQIKQGPERGSWDPNRDRWGSFNGRLYMTCLSIYMLEVYYRHLPIYSGYKAFDALPPVTAVNPKADDAPQETANESDADAPQETADESDANAPDDGQPN